MIDPRAVPLLPGVAVLDVDGDIIGSVERVFIHKDTAEPLWVLIQTEAIDGTRAVAPLASARFDDAPGSALHIGLPRTVIERAPQISTGDTLTLDDVHTLHAYYDPPLREPPIDTVQSPPPAAGTGAVEVVRSEEQLRVSAVRVPTERVRFQKVIVTEEQTFTVTVRREELRMVREPVTDSQGTVAESPREERGIGMVLHEERPVFTMEVIPVERVRVDVITVARGQTVTGTVRKERVTADTTVPGASLDLEEDRR